MQAGNCSSDMSRILPWQHHNTPFLLSGAAQRLRRMRMDMASGVAKPCNFQPESTLYNPLPYPEPTYRQLEFKI